MPLPYFGAVTESQSLTEPKQNIMSSLLYLKAIVVDLSPMRSPKDGTVATKTFQEGFFLLPSFP